MMEDYQLQKYIRSDDQYGGHKGAWEQGMTFKAAIAKQSSPEQQIAEKEGISEAFMMVVEKGVSLEYHDVIKRLSDGSIFRTTSRTKDSTAHPASTVKISTVTVERWELPA